MINIIIIIDMAQKTQVSESAGTCRSCVQIWVIEPMEFSLVVSGSAYFLLKCVIAYLDIKMAITI